MDPVLIVDNLTRRYSNGRGVFSVNFTVNQGDVFGLLGPNGCGKTTTMKAVMGFCRRTSGNISIFGTDPAENPNVALTKVGCLIESPALYSHLSAQEQMLLASRFYDGVTQTRIDELLDQVGLLKYKKDKSSQFSLGMKQRLGIALALIGNPEFIILDEPGNGLDIEGMVEMRNIILSLAKEKKATFLVSSHIAHEIELICNRVGVLCQGKLLNIDTMDNILLNHPTLESYYLDSVRSISKEVL